MSHTMDKLCKIRDLRQAVNRFEADFERRYGISLNEGMVLCSLKEGGRLSSGQLGELLGLTPSNASKVIASAERKGLIVRVLGEVDKRRMYFSITEGGREVIDGVSCEEIPIHEVLRCALDI